MTKCYTFLTKCYTFLSKSPNEFQRIYFTESFYNFTSLISLHQKQLGIFRIRQKYLIMFEGNREKERRMSIRLLYACRCIPAILNPNAVISVKPSSTCPFRWTNPLASRGLFVCMICMQRVDGCVRVNLSKQTALLCLYPNIAGRCKVVHTRIWLTPPAMNRFATDVPMRQLLQFLFLSFMSVVCCRFLKID